jgi:4-amino-4-deoxy-L-arabinose transferase-like glycosyltransferase
MHRSWTIAGTLLFSLLGFVIFPYLIGVPYDSVFASDAIGYSTGAKNLLLHGFYTFDGFRPFMDREPMMSFFLVPLYFLFGIENATAFSIVQGIMLLLAAWFFCNAAAARIGSRAAGIAFLLLLTSGSVFHTVFSAYRECLALSLLLAFSGLFLSSARSGALSKAVLMGIVLGLAVLTYYPFLFFPPFLLFVYYAEKRTLRGHVGLGAPELLIRRPLPCHRQPSYRGHVVRPW